MLSYPHLQEIIYGVVPTKLPLPLDARTHFVTVSTGVSFLAPKNLIYYLVSRSRDHQQTDR